ncbi:Hypothetical protein MELLADRAFT_85122 [Melampsora larici-populina 98AG31]|uniref:Uncharacterized protein n=1 Tax=Melampsora larici-populina (strain 98AG31 / pathotype 3-4-7) TaxID=747676 RepID=F4SCY3_MELLP|nr:Hypothetical protein MELLADRAFT_85122 [Melampsora larici-populina 98AG31]EGF97495.1 Hypothetical protein MELLADRAFT_85122 [Melampsora larici-populina 98AG31]
MSVEVAKMALAMGNTKLVEKFLNSLDKATDIINEVNPLKNYKSGQVSLSELRAFTPYWDTHLKKRDIHFKLTIFNDKWIEMDHMVDGNNTSSKKKDRPTGQPAKSEWWMSFADWTRARTLMLKYLREVYKHGPFAKDLEKHFEYVEKLSLRHSWITAFRYDIMVRTDVLCNRINGAPGDPSVARENFLDEAKARTELLQDGRSCSLDNPYARGGPKEKFSPITGKPYPKGIDHESIDIERTSDENCLAPPEFNQQHSLVERNNNFKSYDGTFKRNDNWQSYQAKNDNYQNRNRRNNRGKGLRKELSPGPYQRFDKSKGKQPEKSNIRDDDNPRQSEQSVKDVTDK